MSHPDLPDLIVIFLLALLLFGPRPRWIRPAIQGPTVASNTGRRFKAPEPETRSRKICSIEAAIFAALGGPGCGVGSFRGRKERHETDSQISSGLSLAGHSRSVSELGRTSYRV